MIRTGVVVLSTLLISACSLFGGKDSQSGRYTHHQDFTPDAVVDINAIQDAVPVAEPRSLLGNPESYKVRGKRYHVMTDATGFSEEGIASWYGSKFHGYRTSNGEIFDVYKMTAAHKTLPLPCYVKVTRKDTGESVIVRVNDRGPFHEGRIIDLSYAAAVKLGVDKAGTAAVKIEVVEPPHNDSVMWIQAGALSSGERAQQLKNRLREITSDQWPVTVSEKQSGDLTLHRVRLGPVSATTANAVVDQLSEAGIAPTVLLMQHQLDI